MKIKQLALALLTLVSLNSFAASSVNIKLATDTENDTAIKDCIKNASSLLNITQNNLKGALPFYLDKLETIRLPEADKNKALAYKISPHFVFDKKSGVANVGSTMIFTCNILIENGKVNITDYNISLHLP